METLPITSGLCQKTCRICLDTNNQKDIISPCLCRGGSEHVHRKCLDNWRSLNKLGRSFSYCDVCQFRFVIVPVINDPKRERKRLLLYYALVFRDIFLILSLWQGILFGLAFLIQLGDKNSQSVRKLFPHYMSSLGVYYLSSLIIFFALLGFIGLIATCINSSSNSDDSCNCTGLQCFCIGSQCDRCEGDSGGGGGLIVVLLIVLIVFAIIGLFVGVFIGLALIQQITKRHTEKLWLRQQTKKYIVKDFQGRRHELSNISSTISATNHPINQNQTNDFTRIQISPSAPIHFSSLSDQDKKSTKMDMNDKS